MRYLKAYFLILLFLAACKNETVHYVNLEPDVDYVGINMCASCHTEKYNSFIKTGMGKSIRPAFKQYSSAIFNKDLIDTNLALSYHPYWFHDSLFIHEYALSKIDTTHSLIHKIDYIIGSGQHTNSHLIETNGYLYQAPLTYYTQDSILDFPPGFDNDQNTRFARKMGLECVACHNAYPDFVLGSENKYQHIPHGIDCERCHGPGELHVNNIANGHLVDTAHYIDYSIVNPADLSPALQNDLCARCHLQGNAVLQENKSFFDFKPGMYLKEVMDVYLPRYRGGGLENQFIMASHVDRMKLSNCYIKSEKEITCMSCHNPHLSVKETPKNIFDNQCLTCHSDIQVSKNHTEDQLKQTCFSCHMPQSKTLDIPHVKITDHKIGIYENETPIYNDQDTIFLGLECINNEKPSYESLAQAYLQQYERFESRSYYLDSALYYLNKIDITSDQGVYMNIYYNFLRNDYDQIIQEVQNLGKNYLLSNHLISREYSNKDAWTCYRIGEAFMKKQNLELAHDFYQQAIKLAPYNLEFRNKYGVVLFEQNKVQFAIDEFQFILAEDHNFTSAYANLGYIYFSLGKKEMSLQYYDYALRLDPYHEKTLINKAEILLLDNNKKDAFICIEKLLRINPENQQAQNLLKILDEV